MIGRQRVSPRRRGRRQAARLGARASVRARQEIGGHLQARRPCDARCRWTLRNERPARSSAVDDDHERPLARATARPARSRPWCAARRTRRRRTRRSSLRACSDERHRAPSVRLAVDLDRVRARLRAEHDAAAGELRRASCPGGRGRCPSGGTASRGRRRPGRGSSWRGCPAGARPLGLHDSCRSGPFGSTPKTTPEVPSCPCRPRFGAVAIRGPPARHEHAGRARHGAGHQQQVAGRVGVDDLRPRWVTRSPPMWPDMRMPFQTRAGRRTAPIEPGFADVVGAVGDRAATEVVALDGARETLALRRAGDLDVIARAERLDGDAYRRPRVEDCRGTRCRWWRNRSPPSGDGRSRACVILLRLGLAESELDGVVAVAAAVLDLRPRGTARPRSR